MDLRLPTRGNAAAYAQTRYKDVFAPLLTSMEMQRHGVEKDEVIEQSLVEFARKTGATISDVKTAFEQMKNHTANATKSTNVDVGLLRRWLQDMLRRHAQQVLAGVAAGLPQSRCEGVLPLAVGQVHRGRQLPMDDDISDPKKKVSS